VARHREKSYFDLGVLAEEIWKSWLEPFRGEAWATGYDQMPALRFRGHDTGCVRDKAEGIAYLLRVELTGIGERGFSGFPLEQ